MVELWSLALVNCCMYAMYVSQQTIAEIEIPSLDDLLHQQTHLLTVTETKKCCCDRCENI